jgi:DNA-binding GntR family transcriptional regulator
MPAAAAVRESRDRDPAALHLSLREATSERAVMTEATPTMQRQVGAVAPEALPAARTTAAAIAAAVRADIVAGRLGPGEKLRQVELARRYGVSTTPVREAFGLLQHQGLVRLDPQRGATVFVPSIEDLEEHYEIRIALECLAAERAALNFQPRDAAPLQALIAEMRGCRDPEQYVDLNHRFHMAVYALSRRQHLMELIDQLRLASQAYLQLYADRVVASGDVEHEHDEILAAVEANDPVAASRATRDHLRLTVLNVTDELLRRD